MANGQAVTHYNRHYLMASMAYVTMGTYTSTNDQWAHPLVSSSKTKLCQFSSVILLCMHLKINNNLYGIVKRVRLTWRTSCCGPWLPPEAEWAWSL